MPIDLQTPIEKIRNVGPRNIPRLHKLGIKTVKDLLWHFPVRYEDYREISPIADLEPGQKVNIQGEVVKINNRLIFPRRMTVTNAIIKDDTGAINAVWFNQPYIANSLTEGTFVSLAGKVSLGKKGISLSSPTYEKIASNIDGPIYNNLVHTGGLIPVYSETEGVSSKYLRFLIKPILGNLKVEDSLPEKIFLKYGFPTLEKSLKTIHHPENLEEAELAKNRIAFDDLFLFQIKSLIERRKINQLKSAPIKFDAELVKSFIAQLPFELTTDQKIAAWEILKDLEKSYPMNRLLEGDVGSGKTVVALIAAVQAAKTGFQSIFLAPTEVLAHQHMRTACDLLKNFDVNIGLLTSSTAQINQEKIKKQELKKIISSGDVKILIGTHAVIQKDVKFHNPALIVIDEQHRFGVHQRKALVSGSPQIDTQINADKLLFEDLTYKIRGAIFNVYNNLGSGHKEVIYHRALIEELNKQKINFDTEKVIPITYSGKKVGTYKADLIVENSVLLELKALPFIGETEKKQIWSYLRGSAFKVALIANFGPELTIKRIVYDNARNSNQRLSALDPRKSAQEMRIPHLLSMTATPIPRTLALSIYGDLDISIIKEKPKDRKKIITRIITPNQRRNAYGFLREEIKRGRQVFVVCPRIELQAQINADATPINTDKDPHGSAYIPHKSAWSQSRLIWAEVKAVEEEYKKLSEEVFPDLRVAMLHGKKKPAEKQEIMNNFKNGDIDLLVSTSVIEVGVDIPNASIMMIENAERFGLAQLHQFRGRVGRAEHQSYCLLFSSTPDRTINQRLKALTETDDGFLLAEKDMAIRGPGEFFGVKQSGLPDLAMASLANVDLIKKARAEARTLLKEDPNLKKYPLLKNRLEQFQKMIHFE